MRRVLVGLCFVFCCVLGLTISPRLVAQSSPKSGGGKVIPLCQTGCITYGVSVSPNGGSDNQPENATGLSYGFVVANTGSTNESDTYTVSCTTSGPVVCDSLVGAGGPLAPLQSSSISPQCFHCGGGGTTISLTLMGGTQSGVTAWAHTQSTTGSGVLTVTATGTHSDSDHGWDNIAVTAPSAPTAVFAPRDSSQIARGLCFTTGAGEAAGVTCGDLFVIHGMPSFRTMGRDRSLTLEYNSATARGTLLVPLNVTEPSTTLPPSSVKVVLTVGTMKDSATFAPPSVGATQRMVLGHGLGALATGLYTASIAVTNVYASTNLTSTVSSRVLVVGRSASPYGRGWSLDGVEQLVPGQTGGGLLWVDGDGSTRLYGQLNSTTWVAPAAAFRDTISYDAVSQHYTRFLRHGVKVVFNAAGQHITTINRLGLTTVFTWTTVAGQSRLTAITLPVRAGAGRTYQLTYNTSTGYLISIKDPGGRQLTASYTGDQLTSVTDPDGLITSFGYDPTTLLMVKRSVPRPMVSGGVAGTVFTYANGVRLTGVKIPAGPTGTDTSRISISAWDEHGLAIGSGLQYGAAIPVGDFGSTVDGPLPGTGDLLTIWTNALGEPTKTILAGTNATTLIAYGDTAHPALATSVRGPRGDSAVLAYNTRGNLVSTRALSRDSLSGAPNQKTLWTYGDANTPDGPTAVQQVVHDAAGPTTRYTYTSLGLDSIATAPNGHQTHFSFDSFGLVQSITEASVTTWRQSVGDTVVQDLVQSFTYDSLGNLRTSQDPAGAVTTILADSLGRVVKEWDVYNTLTQWSYDTRNRVTAETRYTSVKPNPYVSNPAASCDSLSFVCADLTVPWATPDTLSLAMPDSLRTTFTYDTVGLKTVTDPRGVTRGYRYDAQARSIKELGEASDSIVQYVGASGLVDSTRKASGLVIRFHYDAVGRRVAMVYPPRIWAARALGTGYSGCDDNVIDIPPLNLFGTDCTPSPEYVSAPADTIAGDSLVFVFDSVGQLTDSRSAGSPSPRFTGEVTRTYYATGQLKARVTSQGVPDTVQFTYDGLGRRSRMVHVTVGRYRVADTTAYIYSDVTGALDSLVVQYAGPAPDTGRRRVAFTWDQLGRRRQLIYPSGATWRIAHDALGEIRRLEGSPGCNGWGLWCFTLTNDSVDLRGLTLRTDESCPGSPTGNTTSMQDCDGLSLKASTDRYYRLGWLASQHITYGQGDTLIYDASGNIISKHDFWTGMRYVMNHALASNRISSTTIQSNASKTYTWLPGGVRNQELMSGQSGYAGIGDRAYYYDALDRMVGVYAMTDAGLAVSGDAGLFKSHAWSYEAYSLSDNRSVCGYDAEGTQIGPCLSHSQPLVIDGVAIGTNTNGSIWHFITGPGVDDPLIAHGHNVSQIYNQELMYATDGFGRQYNATPPDGQIGPDSTLVKGLNGGGSWIGWNGAGGMQSGGAYAASRDPGSTLPNFSYFRNRFYDMTTGSWSQEDPAGIAGGVNLYAYAGGNPVSFSDPFGLKPGWCKSRAAVSLLIVVCATLDAVDHLKNGVDAGPPSNIVAEMEHIADDMTRGTLLEGKILIDGARRSASKVPLQSGMGDVGAADGSAALEAVTGSLGRVASAVAPYLGVAVGVVGVVAPYVIPIDNGTPKPDGGYCQKEGFCPSAPRAAMPSSIGPTP